jgi:hypothetical protein
MTKRWKTRTALAGGLLASTMLIAPAMAEDLRFWTTENQPERLAKQEELAADFEAKTGISVAVIPVDEKDLGIHVFGGFHTAKIKMVNFVGFANPFQGNVHGGGAGAEG